MWWRYEKLDETGKMVYCPANDTDGSVTGHIVIGVKVWFDENPEERIARGWIKHLYYEDNKEFKKDYPDYDPALHYVVVAAERVDDYTVKDVYHIIEKTEEMQVLEEMLETMNLYTPSGFVQLDAQGGVLV